MANTQSLLALVKKRQGTSSSHGFKDAERGGNNGGSVGWRARKSKRSDKSHLLKSFDVGKIALVNRNAPWSLVIADKVN